MRLHELHEQLSALLSPSALEGPLPADLATYDVEYRVPGGGDWSGMCADVELIVVNHSQRRVELRVQ